MPANYDPYLAYILWTFRSYNYICSHFVHCSACLESNGLMVSSGGVWICDPWVAVPTGPPRGFLTNQISVNSYNEHNSCYLRKQMNYSERECLAGVTIGDLYLHDIMSSCDNLWTLLISMWTLEYISHNT